jgi:hypothetical protein
MPRILDIDLDFFLDTIESRPVFWKRRLSTRHHRPWKPNEVRQFLEQRCGLNQDVKVHAGIGTHHHEAFLWWRQLVEAEELATPFEVVHVDAHADLGVGVGGLYRIEREILYRPLLERSQVQVSRTLLNPGSYLLFAIACQWINRLTYVTHPKWDTADLHNDIFPDGDPRELSCHKLPRRMQR